MTYRKMANLMSEATVATMDYLDSKMDQKIAKDLRTAKLDSESFHICLDWQHEEIHKQDEAFDRFICVYKVVLGTRQTRYIKRCEAMLKDMGLYWT